MPRQHTEHEILLRVTFWVAPLENLLYIVLLILLDSQRDYLLSPVFFLLVFCTLETYLLARFLHMCLLQKISIWNPLFGPFLLWVTPTSWNSTIVAIVIMLTSVLLLLTLRRAILIGRSMVVCKSCKLQRTIDCKKCPYHTCASGR